MEMFMIDSSCNGLKNKVGIITGSARGIGASIAERFLSDGAKVVFIDIDEKMVNQTAKDLDASGNQSLAVAVDLTCATQIQAMAKKVIDHFGTIDILVNNAGIVGPNRPLVEVLEEEWDQVMAIDLKAVFMCSKAVLPVMLKNRCGRIVNVASIAGKEGNPNLVPYSSAKAGVICLTKALAKEVCQQGIYVNCITPAVIETPILSQVTKEVANYMVSKIPMGRMGRPKEVAALVRFLASDECSFTNGACIDISGGRATY